MLSPQDAPESCWICGDPATTREHLIKASDIKEYFGEPKDKKLYLHSDKKINDFIQSPKSDKLTSDAKLCAACNNARTQSYDLAWQQMSRHLRENWDFIRKTRKVDLSKIFPGRTKAASLEIHLYFMKIFGCLITAGKIPIDIKPFARALLLKKAHPEVGLFLKETPKLDGISKLAQISHVYIRQESNFLLADWTYTLSPITVAVTYFSSIPSINEIPSVWHPSAHKKILNISK